MKVTVKAVLIILWIGACALVLQCMRLLRASPASQEALVQCCYRGLARILDIRIRIEGELSAQRPLLLVTNHSSYLDIIVLGAAARVHFAPKADVANWPAIGAICRMTGCVFIDRRVSRTGENVDALRRALEAGNVVALFPEGTTSDGKRVLPFRSSYFMLAEREVFNPPLAIQPATIRYRRMHGLPLDTIRQPLLAWYGDMDLLPHLRELLALQAIEVVLTYHAPLEVSGNSRKNIANICEQTIASCAMFTRN